MGHLSRHRRVLVVRLILCGLVCSAALTNVAHAGNDDGVLIGDEAVLTGGAVTATTDDGSSIWYNPAGSRT